MSQTVRCIILIIRVTASLTLVMVWIIPSPPQNIGEGFYPKSFCVFARNFQRENPAGSPVFFSSPVRRSMTCFATKAVGESALCPAWITP